MAWLNSCRRNRSFVVGKRYLLPMILGVALLLGGLAASPGTASAASFTYVVQWGDTLSGIAAMYGVTVDDLVYANGIANPNLIYAGQVLYIPDGSETYSTAATQTTYSSPSSTASQPSSGWIQWRVSNYCDSGLMANGEFVHHGAAAADASILPIGAQVYLDGLGTYTIKDRFAWDGGEYRLDIWVPSCDQAWDWGVRYVPGYVVSW